MSKEGRLLSEDLEDKVQSERGRNDTDLTDVLKLWIWEMSAWVIDEIRTSVVRTL